MIWRPGKPGGLARSMQEGQEGSAEVTGGGMEAGYQPLPQK